MYRLFVSCPRYIEELLTDEIAAILGSPPPRCDVTTSGVFVTDERASFEDGLIVGARLCLWSRLAGRVHIEVARGAVRDATDLYRLAVGVRWEALFAVEHTFAVNARGSHRSFHNLNSAALKVKDAVADRFRKEVGRRPSVDADEPDVLLYVHVGEPETGVFVDLSGGSLHARGYRLDPTEAPMRENTAAAILMRMGWHRAVERVRLADSGAPIFADPMCGSGTLVIEAAMIAAGIAPGASRNRFGFSVLKPFQADRRNPIHEEAVARGADGLRRWLRIGGRLWASDVDGASVDAARRNATRAGVESLVDFGVRDVARLSPRAVLGRAIETMRTSPRSAVMVATNPPYGVRLDNPGDPAPTFRALGRFLSGLSGEVERLRGDLVEPVDSVEATTPSVVAAVAAGSDEQARALGLRLKRLYSFYNGNLDIRVALIHLDGTNRFRSEAGAPGDASRNARVAPVDSNAEQNDRTGVEPCGDETSTPDAGAADGSGPAPGARAARSDAGRQAGTTGSLRRSRREDPTTGVAMIRSRLRKNASALSQYLKVNAISCYCLYDADIPQYAAAVDVYQGILIGSSQPQPQSQSHGTEKRRETDDRRSGAEDRRSLDRRRPDSREVRPRSAPEETRRLVVIQEYAPPKTVDSHAAAKRLDELIEAVRLETSTDEQDIVVKRRAPKGGDRRYRPNDEESRRLIVCEAGLRFEVELGRYIDTGIFPDHRLLRRRIRELAAGGPMLNLFAYTCTAGVYAAAGGASFTVSVDTSRTYLDWGRRNYALNGMNSTNHEFVRDDARHALDRFAAEGRRFALIFIDPPTYSNRKSRLDDFDVSRDHRQIVDAAVSLLIPDGVIVLSSNFRKFRLDAALTKQYDTVDIAEATLPPDFVRRAAYRHVWELRRKRASQT